MTKLYAYGSYGDKTHGYCGIDECKHTEHKIVLTQALQAGKTYWFSVISDANMRIYRNITPKTNIASGTTLIWSMLDPVSMSYLWQSNTSTAHAVKIGQAGTEMQCSVTATDAQNWFSFLMDFTYYQDVELLNDDMLQIIAAYQRNAPEQYQIVNAEAANFAKALTDLSNIIGSVDYCKLSVSSVGTDGGYIKLNLNSAYKNGVIYRSDYAKKEDDYFEWNVADALNTKGDPTNDVASVVYVIHKTTPVTWDKVFIKSFDDKENIGALTLWNAAGSLKLNASTDQFFLFATNNVNGKLGALEISDEANLQALASATKIVTTPHHVYFSETAPSISNLNGYGWWWKYSASGAASQMYFCYRDNGDTNWKRVYVTNTQPSVSDAYWFDWSKSVLYKGGSSWKAFTEDAAVKIASYFGTVQRYGTARDQLYHGVYQKYTHTVSSALSAGNYYMESDYDTYWVFTTTEALGAGDSLTYNTDDGWITQTRSGVESTVEVKGYRFDNVMHASANEITIDEEKYQRLNVTSRSGDIKGIVAYMEKFPALSDVAYLDAYRKYKAASDSLTAMENELSETLGDLYREGWWQSNDYVDGDEDKLYDDALENLKKIAQPEATYEVSYLHLRGANRDMEYAASYESDMIDWPEVTPSSAIHLIDEEIAVNVWAYVDQLNKCYDIPQKSKLAINTNLTTMAQHSFTDVLTNIADVASRIKGKTSIYDRASALSSYGTLGTSSLEGAIDAAKLQLFGGASTWYTDANGNMVFVSADGSAAMTLTGNGFCIANSKDADGDWNWRTFGTGDGFTADLITAGLIRADRIEAGSIGASKLASDVTSEIDKISGITGWITETELKLEPGRIASEVVKTAEFEGK